MTKYETFPETFAAFKRFYVRRNYGRYDERAAEFLRKHPDLPERLGATVGDLQQRLVRAIVTHYERLDRAECGTDVRGRRVYSQHFLRRFA